MTEHEIRRAANTSQTVQLYVKYEILQLFEIMKDEGLITYKFQNYERSTIAATVGVRVNSHYCTKTASFHTNVCQKQK